ncbi:MAG: LemA family protein [bacterium]|nr:LemA family protein [bacterium]
MIGTATLILTFLATFLVSVLVFDRYNLKKHRKNIDYIFTHMDKVLKKRVTMLPKLIKTVRAYMVSEEKLLCDLKYIEVKYGSSQRCINKRVELDNLITEAFKELMEKAGNYPQMLSSGVFFHILEVMEETETRLDESRKPYNMAVLHYNKVQELFPTRIWSWLMKHKPLARLNKRRNCTIESLFSSMGVLYQ